MMNTKGGFMPGDLRRAYVVELLGTFGLVFFSAAVVCVNYLAIPTGQPMPMGTTPLNLHQSGLAGIALVQGLVYGVLLLLTVPVSGGYLNPAVALTLWVFNRLDSKRMAWLIGAQFVGALLAGGVLLLTFDKDLLGFAHLGTPHVNLLSYSELTQATLYGAAGIELVLTFFMAFAIFAAVNERVAAGVGGALMAAGVLVSFPVTGAGLNPARWFGTVFWENWLVGSALGRGPFADALVYLAGPILGALLAGAFTFLVYARKT